MNSIKFYFFLTLAFIFGSLGLTGTQILLEGKAYGQAHLSKGGGPGPSFGGGPGPSAFGPQKTGRWSKKN